MTSKKKNAFTVEGISLEPCDKVLFDKTHLTSCKHQWSPWMKIMTDVNVTLQGVTISYAGLLRACRKCMMTQTDANIGWGNNDKTNLEETETKQGKKKTSKRKKK